MAEAKYDFQHRMRQVHRPRRQMGKRPLPGQITITGHWQIQAPKHSDLLARVALDLQDYFQVSMGITVAITPETVSDFVISYEIDPSLSKEGAYRVAAEESRIRLIGQSERAAAQASYLLEDLLNLAWKVQEMGKSVWLYTGYTYESIVDAQDEVNYMRFRLACAVDVLVDGEYREDERDITLKYRGSRNQRLIDMQRTSVTLDLDGAVLKTRIALWGEDGEE